MEEEKLLSGKELEEKIEFFRKKIEESMQKRENCEIENFSWPVEFEMFMIRQGFYSQKYFSEFYDSLKSKLPEKDKQKISKISAILEYRMLLKEHLLDLLQYTNPNKPMLSDENKGIVMMKAYDVLEDYISFYFQDEFKEHKINYNELRSLVVGCDEKALFKELKNVFDQYGISSKSTVKQIKEKAKKKYESRNFITAAKKELDAILSMKGVVKPSEILNELIQSYEKISKINEFEDYKKKSESFIDKLNEFEYYKFKNIVKAQINLKNAIYWNEQLDESFVPDFVEKYGKNLPVYKNQIPKKELITKNAFSNILSILSSNLDDLFYLRMEAGYDNNLIKMDEKSDFLIRISNYFIEMLGELKLPYGSKDEQIKKNIGCNVEQVVTSLECFLYYDMKD